MGPGSTISIMCILLIIDIIISWRLVSMVYDKQWDVKSSMIIYGVITAIYSIGTVGFISDLVPENKQNITLIMGIPFIILMIVINVLMFIAVRKLKYVEASIPLQAHQELKKYKGSLKEENMVCLVPRKEIFNVQVYLEIAKRKNQQELEDIEIIDNKDTKTIASDKSKS
ncbi:MAG: hypothetical protein U9Q15_04280 [Patescibacteria group bacterium]|nr:hypothetical protein [Patescibacteria group bacterium]